MSDQEKVLFEKLDIAVEKYRLQSKKMKILNYIFRIILLLLAATSTMLLGYNIPNNPDYIIWSRNLALVLGAISTFLIGLSAFWNLEPYWHKSKVLFARLRALSEICQFRKASSGTLSPEEVAQAFSEYRGLMDGQIEYWEMKIETQKQNETKAHKAQW